MLTYTNLATGYYEASIIAQLIS